MYLTPLINYIDAGVESVWASPDTGLVFVAGEADAQTVQRRIEHKMGKPVTIVSDGERCYPTYTRMEHLGPPQGYPQLPPYQPYAGGWYNGPVVGWSPVVAPPQPYHHYAPVDRQYMPNGAPVYFNDENPNACCIQ